MILVFLWTINFYASSRERKCVCVWVYVWVWVWVWVWVCSFNCVRKCFWI